MHACKLYEMRACERHAYEVAYERWDDLCEMHAYERRAYKLAAYERHAYRLS
jgi:hypothetical protein